MDKIDAISLTKNQVETFRKHGTFVAYGADIQRERTKVFIREQMLRGAEIRCYDLQLCAVGTARVVGCQTNDRSGLYDYIFQAVSVAENVPGRMVVCQARG